LSLASENPKGHAKILLFEIQDLCISLGGTIANIVTYPSIFRQSKIDISKKGPFFIVISTIPISPHFSIPHKQTSVTNTHIPLFPSPDKGYVMKNSSRTVCGCCFLEIL